MIAMLACFAFAIAFWTAAAIGVRRQVKSEPVPVAAPANMISAERPALADLADVPGECGQQMQPAPMPRAPFTEAEFARMWGDL